MVFTWAIVTKYLGPSDKYGARILARTEGGTKYVPYEHAWNAEENHEAAAMQLAFVTRRFKSTPEGRLDILEFRDQWVCGELPKNSSGLRFVFVRRDK